MPRFLWTGPVVTEVDGKIITPSHPRALRPGASWPELMSGSIGDAKQWLIDNGYSAVQVIESAGDAESVCDAVVDGPTNCCGFIVANPSFRYGWRTPTVTLTACGTCANTVYSVLTSSDESCWPGNWITSGGECETEASFIPSKHHGTAGSTHNCSQTLFSGLSPGGSYLLTIDHLWCNGGTSKTFRLDFKDASGSTLSSVSWPTGDHGSRSLFTSSVQFSPPAGFAYVNFVWPTFFASHYRNVSVCELL